MIDCLQDENNSKCLVPDFIGKSKKDVLRWLSSISNTIEIEIKTVEDPTYKDGTVLEQSIIGTSVKDLLAGKTKLVVTIVNNGSLVDCSKNSKNNKCALPDFVNKKRNDVENWLDGITNNVKIKYVYVDSNKPAGTIINQSIKRGTVIKNILDKDETIIIYISKEIKIVQQLIHILMVVAKEIMLQKKILHQSQHQNLNQRQRVTSTSVIMK